MIGKTIWHLWRVNSSKCFQQIGKTHGSLNNSIMRCVGSFLLAVALFAGVTLHGQTPPEFHVWVFSDAHVGADLRGSSWARSDALRSESGDGRESLATALRQSEGESGFRWDIALDLGDLSGAQGTPMDYEGQEIVRQFAVLKQHHRDDIYDVCGNHDRSGTDESQAWWWRKWVDPTGEHSEYSQVNAAKRPYPIDGTWERYSFRVGNLLFLMMSDINEPTQKIGRGKLGGNPGGVVGGETFRWWKRMVEENPRSIIITVHHYVLKNTTVASGEWEGMVRTSQGEWQGGYHGYYPQGTPQGASFLYWVDSKEDSGAFEKFLNANPGRVDLWLGGHTHTSVEDTYGGKSHVERRWGGTTFINVAALNKFQTRPGTGMPRSWLLTFTEGSDEVTAQCYLHGSEFAPQGWYPKLDRKIKLSKSFLKAP